MSRILTVPPSFEELKRLAVFSDAQARDCKQRADVVVKVHGNPAPLLQTAKAHQRIADILDWLSGRATRLDLLADPVRREGGRR